MDSCKVYSNVAFRAGTACHVAQAEGHQSIVGCLCRTIHWRGWKTAANIRTAGRVQACWSERWMAIRVSLSGNIKFECKIYWGSFFCGVMGPIDGGRLVNGCHRPWMLGLSVWKGLRMRMISRPDWLVSLVRSSEICGAVLDVTISSLMLPFTAGREKRKK